MQARRSMIAGILACGGWVLGPTANAETPPDVSGPPLRAAKAVSSQADAPSNVRIARLIDTLGASEYARRQSADDQLARLGLEARDQLEVALDSQDAEVRLRAQQLLDRIKVAELWAPSYVEIELEQQPVSKGFEAASRQTKNHLSIGDAHAALADAIIDAAPRPASFWEVVDELCRKSGNHVRPNYDSQSPGLVVVSGAPGQYPTAYAGPFRAQLTSARRLFTEELDYETGKSSVTNSFQFNVQLMWEDRLRLVAHTAGPTMIETMPAAGKAAPASASTNAAWTSPSASTRQINASLRVAPPKISDARLHTLRLKWGFVAVGDMQTARIEPFGAKQRFQKGDLLVTIDHVERQPSGRVELTVVVARELALPEPQDVLLEENRVELLDQHGKRFRALSQSNTLTEGGVQMTLSLTGESADSEPRALEIAYPRLRSRREVEIVFRDTPLPLARPE